MEHGTSLAAALCGLCLGAASAQSLPEVDVRDGSAIVRSRDGELTVSSDAIARRWRWDGRVLQVLSLANPSSGAAWLAEVPAWGLDEWIDPLEPAAEVDLRVFRRKPGLEVRLLARYAKSGFTVVYSARVWPGHAGIRTELLLRAHGVAPRSRFDLDRAGWRHVPEAAGAPSFRPRSSFVDRITIDLGLETSLSAFSYSARRGGGVSEWEFEVLDDLEREVQPVASGRFEKGGATQVVEFPDVRGRYIRFVARAVHDDFSVLSMRDLRVFETGSHVPSAGPDAWVDALPVGEVDDLRTVRLDDEGLPVVARSVGWSMDRVGVLLAHEAKQGFGVVREGELTWDDEHAVYENERVLRFAVRGRRPSIGDDWHPWPATWTFVFDGTQDDARRQLSRMERLVQPEKIPLAEVDWLYEVLWRRSAWLAPQRLRVRLGPEPDSIEPTLANCLSVLPTDWTLEEDLTGRAGELMKWAARHRDWMRRCDVLPIGHRPNGRSWFGYQWHDEASARGALLLIREPGDPKGWSMMRLPFLAGQHVTFIHDESGIERSVRVGADGVVEFSFAVNRSYRVLRYVIHGHGAAPPSRREE